MQISHRKRHRNNRSKLQCHAAATGTYQPETPTSGQGLTVPAITPTIAAPIRRSQRAAAQKPKGFYAESTTCESVRDYIACHMSAHECAELYGKEAQVAAGAEEIMNVIGRGALIPRDYRELTPSLPSSFTSPKNYSRLRQSKMTRPSSHGPPSARGRPRRKLTRSRGGG